MSEQIEAGIVGDLYPMEFSDLAYYPVSNVCRLAIRNIPFWYSSLSM